MITVFYENELQKTAATHAQNDGRKGRCDACRGARGEQRSRRERERRKHSVAGDHRRAEAPGINHSVTMGATRPLNVTAEPAAVEDLDAASTSAAGGMDQEELD